MPETGELEKIDTQWADNRTVITRVGACLGVELKDGLSAWKRGVRRPGWERLLERVESGESDGIVVWHTDRLFRQPRDLETLIELGERGFKVYSAHGERDLADPDDRFILRIEVAHAARSSDDTSRRLKRRFATYREQGKDTGGQRRFGFPGRDTRWVPGPDETNADRPQVAGEQVERERAAIRDGAELLLSEDGSAQKVADLWNGRGLRSVNGLEFTADTATAIMKRQALGGFIVHHGAVAGRLPGVPVLDQRTFERVQALYAGRKRGRVAGKAHVGTGILRCAVCGRKLSARNNKEATYPEDGQWRYQYFCPKQRRGCGTVFIDGRAVDRELLAFTVARLLDEQHAREVSALQSRTSDRLGEVRAEITQIEGLQQALSERLGARRISLDAFDVANEPLATDLARLSAERFALTAQGPAGPTEAASAQTLADEWETGDIAERRAMLTRALGRDRMMVSPADRTGKRSFDRNRLRPLPPPEVP
ncbi:recombinase family protein [Amycolatopsis jiangsuensis]|uniref:recombinase family protein n=1 Tax=Amycolatopsis jiangsuensis TaxID=1181879 RepID=UPI001620313C